MSIQFHRENFGTAAPAVNVKCYELAKLVTPEMDAELLSLLGKRGASDEQSLIDDDMAVSWWDQAQGIAQKHYGPYMTVLTEGRSGGWLVLDKAPFTADEVEWVANTPEETLDDSGRTDRAEILAKIKTWEAFQADILAHLAAAPEMYRQHYQDAINRAKDALAEAMSVRDKIVDKLEIIAASRQSTPEERRQLFQTTLEKHFGPPKP